MDLIKYQTQARHTAIYPEMEGSDMIYPALGLVGECGEVADKAKKIIRDSSNQLTPDRASAIAKELGDCCWYLANICYDLGLSLDMMYYMRGRAAAQSARELPMSYLVIRMNMRASEIAKILEDIHASGQDPMTVANRSGIQNHISYTITYIEAIAEYCGYTLSEICEANIENLAGRKKRGTIHGDGDDR